MKKRTAYILALLLSLGIFSCSEDETHVKTEDGISITFRTAGHSEVSIKSVVQGDDDFNENLLNSIYYFFYPKDSTRKTPAVSGFKSGISETEEYSVTIPVSSNTLINNLFKADNMCQLFAVANPPAELEALLKNNPTLAQLRASVVLSSLKEIPQDNFVMVYDGLVEIDSRTAEVALDATVEMKRLATKFTIGAYVSPQIIDGDRVYTPDGVSVSICNGINRTALKGWDKTVVSGSDYFDTESAALGQNGTETVDGESFVKFCPEQPLYTYPMEWEFNSKTEPYLLYDVRWKVTEEGKGVSYKDLYYKLTLGKRSILSNEWYDLFAKLTILGSLYPEEPTEIYFFMDYQVADWTLAFDPDGAPNTPADIKDTRYLVVTQKEWTLNNKDVVEIPFSSSHVCSYSNLKVTCLDYKTGEERKTVYPSSGHTLNQLNKPVEIVIDNSGVITVAHELTNSLGAGNKLDVTPYTIEFDFHHDSTDPDILDKFTEHITIIQYPALSLVTYANSGGRSSSNDYGYTYVNSRQSGNWQIVLGANNPSSSSDNTSIYLTVITVTQFDPSTRFIVGDPRNPEYNNLNTSTTGSNVSWHAVNPVNAPTKYKGDGQTGNRQIKYYHPTIDDGTMDNVVAPSFRVNSANCRSGQNETYQDARQRCASYQEDGYPAGRWRLPTLAECKVIQTLSSNGLIPTIFIQKNSAYYYYAGGWFLGNANAATPGDWHDNDVNYHDAAARCVYDEWYWSQVDDTMGWDNSDKDFVWGDVPDDFVIPASSN